MSNFPARKTDSLGPLFLWCDQSLIEMTAELPDNRFITLLLASQSRVSASRAACSMPDVGRQRSLPCLELIELFG